MPLSYPQVRTSIVVELAGYLKGLGVDYARLRAAVGFEPLDVSDPKQSVPLDSVVALFEDAAAATGDACLGLHFGQRLRLGGSGLIGLLVLNAPCVRAAIRCFEKYVPVFMTGCTVEVVEHEAGSELRWRFPDVIATPRDQYNLFLAASSVVRIRRATGDDWMPVAVDLEGPAPHCRDEITAFFGPNVAFERSCSSILIGRDCLDNVIPDANSQLFAYLVELADKWLAEGAQPPGIAAAVRFEILSQLRRGGGDLDQVARAFDLTGRALQWRLEQAGTSFEKVRTETRTRLAEYYLRETDRPLVEIAHDLGFSEQSAFTRAARRWFKKSPMSYRREVRSRLNDSAA